MDYVYAIKCPYTERVVYVGKSKKPACRINQHFSGYSNISKYLRCMYSLGKPAIIAILDSHERCAKSLETYYIRFYSLFNQANHNVSENNSKHKACSQYIIKADNEPVIIELKKEIIQRLQWAFYHKENCHKYKLHALRQILYYVNNPT